jgi:hypothetical protein
MSAIAHGWEPTGSAAKIPLSVARDFHEADKGHKYGAGRAMGGVAPMLAQASSPMAPGGLGAAMPQPAPGVRPLGINAPPGMGFSPMATGGSLGIPGPSTSPAKPVKMTTGPLVSSVPGRTDKHFTHVPSGSYVIPADIVSGHGQGNTLAGMNALHNLFRMGQAGKSMTKNFPGKPVGASKFSKGGADHHVGKPVPVKLAGGEIVVPPHNVHETMQRLHRKRMTLDEAHRHMDDWVVKHRRKLRKTLAKLPGPVVN